MKIFYALLVTATTIACSEQKFKGSTAHKNPASGKPPRTESNATIENSQTTVNAEDGVVKAQKCSADYQIPGSANPYFAGSPSSAKLTYSFHSGNNTDPASTTAPVQIVPLNDLCLKAASKLTFATTGSLSHGAGTAGALTPEGNGTITGHALGAQLGKSDLVAPFISVVAVFIGKDDPSTQSPPVALDFSTAQARNYKSLEPKLGQIFFVGDGKTDAGEAQVIVVPPESAQLYMAVWDTGQWNNNVGSMVGAINLVP